MTEAQSVDTANVELRSREVYNAYAAERERLVAHEFEASRDLDKWLLSIAGGSLALSITFISDIVTPAPAKWTLVLLIGWFCLIASVAFCLFAMRTGHDAYSTFRRIMDEEGGNGFEPGYWKRVRSRQNSVPEAKHSLRQSVVSFWCLILGFVFLGLFVFINMR